MNIFAVSGLLIIITAGAEALLLFIKGRRLFHYLWGFFCVSVFVWGFGSYMIAINPDPVQAVLWWRVTYVGVIFIPIILAHFVYSFLEIKKKKTIALFYIIGVFFVALDLFSDLFINNVRFVFGQFYYISSPTIFYTSFVLIFIGLVVYILIKLWRAYLSAKGIKKSQLKYIVFSLALGFLGGSFSFLPVYQLDFYPFLNLMISFGVAMVAYAILRYRLMDIRVIVRKLFIYFSASALTFAVFYLVVGVYNEIFGSVYTQAAYFAGVFASFIFVFIIYSFEGVLLKISNRYFFVSLYNYQEIINKLSRELNHYNDLDKIINVVINTINKTMILDRAGVLLVDETKGSDRFKIAKIFGFGKKTASDMVKDNFFVPYLQKTKQPLLADELSLKADDARNSSERANLEKIYRNMNKVGISLCLPLLNRGKMIGAIFLGEKRSEAGFSSDDLKLLSTLANQAGIAVNNALLYKRVNDFNKGLQCRVDDQTREIRQKAKELEKKNENLNKLLQVKNEFLRMVNHQLNTPVSIIRNSIFMIKTKAFPLEKGLDYIEKELGSMEDVFNEFWKAFSFEGEGLSHDLRETNIEEIVDRAAEAIKQIPEFKEKKLSIVVEKDFVIPKVKSDINQIAHVLNNLLENAVSYTSRGGVKISFKKLDDKFLKIFVKDTGCGIDKKDQGKLFEKFSRGEMAIKARPNGSGLGLYIAKRIVDSSGGKLELEKSVIGKGTTFSLTLPIWK